MQYFSRNLLTVIIAGLCLGGVLVVAAQQPAAAHPTIDIAASNWKFTPAKIVVPVGEQTTLRLTSTSGVHGIQSGELGIPQTTISPGSFVQVSFTPKKAGTYKVYCAVMCGPGHQNMYLTIEVK